MNEAASVPVFDWRPQVVVAGIINALINGGLGFLVPVGHALPLWGLPSLGFDVVAMAFGIAFGTGLIVTPQLRSLRRRGRIRAPAIGQKHRDSFARWPGPTLQRSINLGVLGVLIFAPLPLLALWGAAPHGLEREAVIVFKATFGFVEGAIVTPIIALAALTTPDPA